MEHGLRVNHLQIEVSSLESDAFKILEILRPSWPKRLVRFKRFHEGVMNILVGCYLDGKYDEDVVLIRKYGNNTNLLVDRKAEIDIIRTLNQNGICMPLYATLTNGIVYGFVHGETLNVDMVRDEHIARLIAREMAKLHSTKLKETNPKSGLFEKLDKWIENISECFEDPVMQSRFHNCIKPKDYLTTEKDILVGELQSLDCPIVLCHNDLALTNIIYNKEKDEVKFIDFEFATYNFNAFDIGNHFMEYAGIRDIAFGNYPDKDYQLKWIRNYLTCWKEYNNEETDVTDRDVETLYIQANKCTLVGHFLCGLWALIQTKHGDIDYDYLGYAKKQFDEYDKKKIIFIDN